jgi:hypothetical protein
MEDSKTGERSHGIELSARSSPAASTEKHVTSNTHNIDAEYQHEATGDLAATQSTPSDAAAMRRLGKEQQLVRSFRIFSVTSFTAIATAAWELGVFLISPGLQNGGRATVLWSTIWGFVGFAPNYLSMAEMGESRPNSILSPDLESEYNHKLLR